MTWNVSTTLLCLTLASAVVAGCGGPTSHVDLPPTTPHEQSLLWNSSLTGTSYQVRAGFEQPTGKMMQEMWPIGELDGYVPMPDRPLSCTDPGFLSNDGRCPDDIVLTYRLRQEDRGRADTWDFRFGHETIAGDVRPFLELYVGEDDQEPCGHREMCLYHYSMLGKMRHTQVRPNPDRADGLWPLGGDVDLVYRFKYKVLERTPSQCDGAPIHRRNLLKAIVMYDHLTPDGRARSRRPNAISIWVDRDGGAMPMEDRPGRRERWFDDEVIWWNRCRAHGDWGNTTCMLALWIGDSDRVRPIEGSDYREVEINLSELYRRYSDAFPPPFGQSSGEAVFRNIAAVATVSGSMLRARVADVDLVGRPWPSTE